MGLVVWGLSGADVEIEEVVNSTVCRANCVQCRVAWIVIRG